MDKQQYPKRPDRQGKNTAQRWSPFLFAGIVLVGASAFPVGAMAQGYDPDAAAANCRQFTQSVRNLRQLADRQDVLAAVKLCIDLGVDPPLKARRDYGRTPASGIAEAQIPGRTCPPFSTCLYSARVNESAVDPIRYNAGSGGTLSSYDGLGGGAGAFNANNNNGTGAPSGSGEGTGYGDGVGVGGGPIGSEGPIGGGGNNPGGGDPGGGDPGGGDPGGGDPGGGDPGGGDPGGGDPGGGDPGGGDPGGGDPGGGDPGGGDPGGGDPGGGDPGGGDPGGGIGDPTIPDVYDAPQFTGHLPPEIPEHLVDGATIYFYGDDISITPPMNSLIYPITGTNYYADGGTELIQEGHIMTPPAENGDMMAQRPVIVNEQVLFNFDDGGIIVLPDGYVGVIGGIEVKGGDLIFLYHSEDTLIPPGTKLYPLPMGSNPEGEHKDDPEWEPYTGPAVKYPPNAIVFNQPEMPGKEVWWVAP